ncbi:MAG: glutaredoxin family protein [Deltaproteobacteria bacterium]|nr:MAG: glutaredoxin family protein [Deltaproteobacteria bacterium]
MVRVEIFGKADCPLCDEALEAARLARGKVPFELRYVDITSDAALFERYRYEIPVVHVDGFRAFKHRVDPDALAARVRRAQEQRR